MGWLPISLASVRSQVCFRAYRMVGGGHPASDSFRTRRFDFPALSYSDFTAQREIGTHNATSRTRG